MNEEAEIEEVIGLKCEGIFRSWVGTSPTVGLAGTETNSTRYSWRCCEARYTTHSSSLKVEGVEGPFLTPWVLSKPEGGWESEVSK